MTTFVLGHTAPEDVERGGTLLRHDAERRKVRTEGTVDQRVCVGVDVCKKAPYLFRLRFVKKHGRTQLLGEIEMHVPRIIGDGALCRRPSVRPA